MRTPRNDQLSKTGRAGKRGEHGPERRCVVTGEVAPADRLVRLALGPDGTIAPDVLGKAPGRGADRFACCSTPAMPARTGAANWRRHGASAPTTKARAGRVWSCRWTGTPYLWHWGATMRCIWR